MSRTQILILCSLLVLGLSACSTTPDTSAPTEKTALTSEAEGVEQVFYVRPNPAPLGQRCMIGLVPMPTAQEVVRDGSGTEWGGPCESLRQPAGAATGPTDQKP